MTSYKNNNNNITLTLYYCYKLSLYLGINCNRAYNNFIYSEYSKIINNLEDLKQNIEYYKLNNIDFNIIKHKNKYLLTNNNNNILNPLKYIKPDFDI